MTILALVDGNNFFVSCQRVFEPKLEGRPVIVLSNNDGCVIARSNEAKALGIKMGEPYFKARPIIEAHNVRVFSANLELYCDMSRRMMNILRKYAPRVEEYSIDEAFLDFTDVNPKDLNELGQAIKNDILKSLGLPVCVGFGHTKTLAKAANRLAKKYVGLQSVYYYEHMKSTAPLNFIDINDVWGLGRAYATKLKAHGIKTAYDLTLASPDFVRKHLSIVGARVHQELTGISCYPLITAKEDKKSITVSRTLKNATSSKDSIKESIATHTVRGCEKLRAANLFAKELTIFITTTQYAKGKQYEKSFRLSLIEPTNLTNPFLSLALKMVDEIFKQGYQYKKTGVTFSKIGGASSLEKDLFFEGYDEPPALSKAIDVINQRYGNKALIYGATGINRAWQQTPREQSPRYTTRIEEILKIS